MAEETRIALAVKVAAVCLTAVGLVWGVTQFLITKRIEARKAYLTYQLETYQDAAKVAAQLASLPQDHPDRPAALARFWKLYWGELVLVEDPVVEARMVAFKNGMETGSRHQKALALCLSHGLSKSLADSWNVPEWEFARDIGQDKCEALAQSK